MASYPGHSESTDKSLETSAPTVLLVEDEDPLRNVIDSVLQGRGYHVIAAESAEAALQAANDFGRVIDVLLTDLSLPRMDGYSLAARLVGDGLARHVIYMSGYAEDPQLIRPIGNQHPAFIEKPFRLKELVAAVNQAVE